jgi:HlyD family secretion protein
VGFGSTITDNVVTYLTYLDVDNADLSLRPGMTATATITATQRKDVLLVPNTRCASRPPRRRRQQPPRRRHRRQPDAAAGRAPRASRPRPAPAPRRRARCGCCATATPVALAVTPGISDGRMTEITGGDLQPACR